MPAARTCGAGAPTLTFSMVASSDTSYTIHTTSACGKGVMHGVSTGFRLHATCWGQRPWNHPPQHPATARDPQTLSAAPPDKSSRPLLGSRQICWVSRKAQASSLGTGHRAAALHSWVIAGTKRQRLKGGLTRRLLLGSRGLHPSPVMPRDAGAPGNRWVAVTWSLAQGTRCSSAAQSSALGYRMVAQAVRAQAWVRGHLSPEPAGWPAMQ